MVELITKDLIIGYFEDDCQCSYIRYIFSDGCRQEAEILEDSVALVYGLSSSLKSIIFTQIY